MKQCYIFIILLLFITPIYSQRIDSGDVSGYNGPHLNTLDTTSICIYYRQKIVHDTLGNSNVKDNYCLLQIGNRISKYADFYAIKTDSLLAKTSQPNVNKLALINEAFKFRKGASQECIFRNYPNNNLITVTNSIGRNYYKYEEESIEPKWKLGKETKTISGHTCKNATTRFFGRNYTAWYATDIPMNNGPWKFSGLPGLILKVEDDRGQISFECVSIEKPKSENIIFMTDHTYIKLKKKTFNNTLKKFYDNPGAYIQSEGISVSLDAESTKKLNQKKPYNPIEIAD